MSSRANHKDQETATSVVGKDNNHPSSSNVIIPAESVGVRGPIVSDEDGVNVDLVEEEEDEWEDSSVYSTTSEEDEGE